MDTGKAFIHQLIWDVFPFIFLLHWLRLSSRGLSSKQLFDTERRHLEEYLIHLDQKVVKTILRKLVNYALLKLPFPQN
jgi:hypothetical protein